MTALVSIVLPTYDRPELLRRALASALAQTHTELEVVVADDRGHDDTQHVVASFDDPRVVYLRQPENVGMVRNWGDGLRRARGELVAFLADDDVLSPSFVLDAVEALAADPGAVAAFGAFEVRDLDGRLVRVHGEDWARARVLDGSELLRAALGRRWFVGAALYRREAVLEAWPHVADDDLVLDYALNLRLALRADARALYLPGARMTMTEHGGQNSTRLRARVREQTVTALERVLADASPAQARLVRRELATWRTAWGRDLTGWTARAHFLAAIRLSPRLAWPWRQLAASFVPGRHA